MTDASKHFYLRDHNSLAASSKLTAKAKQSILLSKAENTIDAYESDWNDFVDWCNFHHVTAFPAIPETIVNYINDLADYAKANTISRRISAISENFNASGMAENPCASILVKQALRGIRRLKGTYQQGKTPILLEDLEDIFEEMPKLGLSEIQLLRDKAILLIGFMGAFRRSELSKITVETLHFSPQGVEIFVKASKADQEGQGAVVAIPYVENSEFCAVRALKAWLRYSGIKEGPIFRGFTKTMTLRKTAISDKSIAEIVKKYVAAIGLNPDMYGAHSLRHGFATTAAAFGVEERNIMRQTRHHSVAMVRRYINEANKFVDNPISSIFNKR
ncbi:site-specific integrase [Veillonella magna]|uniref:Site-specific integrase n=2 Tax=Veillonella magna TaxID=464322 RepID=A0ABS2GD41_9FIRM|nr:site-specific integrase [Veillonella magna]MBM6823582.1 site-specific integrase [Veillonella magna]MBM6911926.1 site-specific integrase [Veillonella magna]